MQVRGEGRESRRRVDRFGGGLSNAPDSVASSKSNPLRNRAVLLLGLGKLLLGTERLVALEGGFVSISIVFSS